MRPAVLYTLVTFSSGAFAQSFLDPGFASNGVFIQSLSDQGIEKFTDLVPTSDGGVVAIAAGVVLKLNEDGTTDQAFGSNGIAYSSIWAEALAVDGDGSILLAGSAYIDFLNRPCIVKLQPNGSLDPTFGDQGVVTFMELYDGAFTTMQIKAGGGVIVGGYYFLNADLSPVIARVDNNGDLEAGFATNGVSFLNQIPDANSIADLLDIPDDQTLVSCEVIGGHLAALLDASGTLVNTFGNGGILSFTEESSITGCSLDETGMILMGTTTTDVWDNVVQCRRFDMTGTLDESFGANGTATVDPGSVLRAISARPCPTPDGGIIIGGKGIRNIGLIAIYPFFCGLLHNGSIDPSVGLDGVMLDTVNRCEGYGPIRLGQEGRIYSWGGTTSGTDSDLIITRYSATPVGMVEHQVSSDFLIWPQPVVDYLNIFHREKQGVIGYDVFDLLGRRISGFVGNRSPDMSTLISGVYVLVERESGRSLRFLKD